MKKIFFIPLICIIAASNLQALKIDSLQNNTTFDIEYFYTKNPTPYPYSETFIVNHGQKIDLRATYLNQYVHILYPNKLLFTIKLADGSARFLFTPQKTNIGILEEWSPLTPKEGEKERYDTFTVVMLPVESSPKKLIPYAQIVILGNRPYLIGNKEKTVTKKDSKKSSQPYRSHR